jgi:hypothetical protein
MWTTCARRGGREFPPRNSCGALRGGTRTSPSTSTDSPSTAGPPARRAARRAAGPAGPGPEGERRATSGGQPAELRMTTQRLAGPRRSDRRRPARGEALRGRSRVPGRSRTVRAAAGSRLVGDVGTTGRDRPLGRVLRGAFLRVRTRLSTGPVGDGPVGGGPNGGDWPPDWAICPDLSTTLVPTLCTRVCIERGPAHPACGRRVHARWTDRPVRRGGAATGPPAPRSTRRRAARRSAPPRP